MITKEKLTTAGTEKLAEILLSLYESHKDIRKELNILFAGLDKDPKKLVSAIKKEIVALKKSTRFVDYYASDALADHLNQLKRSIVTDLKEKSIDQATTCLQDFLDLHDKTFNRVDDSNGAVGGVFREACEDLGQLYKENPHKNEEVVNFVFQHVMNNDWGVYDKIIHFFAEALGSQGLNELKDKIKAALDKKNDFKVKSGLQEIADAQKDVDAYIAACQFTGAPHTHDHLEIAKRLIQHWRGEEALTWVEKADIAPDHGWQKDKTVLKIQALELCGSYDQAHDERLKWFEKSLSPETYGQILKHSKEDAKKTFRIQAIERAFTYQHPTVALSFLMQVQEFEEAARFVRLHSESLYGRAYTSLRPAAEILKDIDPLAATLLYRQLLQAVLKEAKSKYYTYAAKDLIACGFLAEKISDWAGFKDHQSYFEELILQNKRKVSFWETYNVQFQKNHTKQTRVLT